MKPIRCAQNIYLADRGDHYEIIAQPDSITEAAAAVVEARFSDGGDWDDLKNAISELAGALIRSGYSDRLPSRAQE